MFLPSNVEATGLLLLCLFVYSLHLSLSHLTFPISGVQVHYYSSSVDKHSSNDQCCGLSRISANLACCNYKGYDATTHVCADFGPDEIKGTHCTLHTTHFRSLTSLTISLSRKGKRPRGAGSSCWITEKMKMKKKNN